MRWAKIQFVSLFVLDEIALKVSSIKTTGLATDDYLLLVGGGGGGGRDKALSPTDNI